jgi:hypothetical protein
MRSFFVAAGAATFVLVACGGKFNTSVDGSKPTNSLSPTDSQQLCLDEYNYLVSSFSLDDFASMSCAQPFTGVPDCNAAFQTCVANAKASGQWPPPQTPDCSAFQQSLASCNVTVSQYTDCITQEVNVFKSIEAKLPFCTDGEAQSAYLQAESQVSAQCLDIFKNCPIDFGGSSQSGGGTVDAGLPDGG